MEQVFTKDVWFSWILLSGLILRTANRNRSNPLYWILTICWFSFSSAVTKKLLKFKDLQRRYKILRKECEISPTALALYEKPTSGIIIRISTSSNFFIKEIRAIMLIFVALVFVYVVNSISEEYKDHPCFQKFVIAVNYIQSHFIEFLIGIWSIWFILPAFISVANK
ncbi:Oidioi.mRNA.OKI2018_I69.chr2.g7042.t1.cds [Oikopleura dioica]|uniref:Oidioi.mRNA.OKI2018_I69.chr2.g7042.t1.cds n=1 Tax=Oikopleura dioica TaxID=34765 RepID=A0ABN7T787_OIKDI|nr:Oidioi.mRNA.OKI2018_I69.chr2.g7042.t1.cds [Oikopleura dioica]